METKVTFKSDELTLSGILHVPDGLASDEKRPAFIVMHGFGGYMDGPEQQAQARILCEWGYVALRFDFRGCGESEGERVFGRDRLRIRNLFSFENDGTFA